MLSFSSFIKETLNWDQQHYIDHYINWDDPEKRDVDFSDHLFDKDRPPSGGVYETKGQVIDRDSVVFDIPKPEHIHPEKHIERYLRDRGYHIHDYAAGLAKSTRPSSRNLISIGRILSKPHKIPISGPHMRLTSGELISHPDWNEYVNNEKMRKAALADFTTSDIRAAMKTPLQIMITRDPYKVAGMSTGTPRWKSCMFLGTCPTRDLADDDWHDGEESVPYNQRRGYDRPGMNAKRMNDELLSGTHVAYLIAAGDHGLKNPFARISLKPYHSEDINEKIRRLPTMSQRYGYTWDQIKPEHTILRPAVNTYTSDSIMRSGGGLTDHFRRIVNDLTRAHFPMKHDVYHIDPMSYKDSGDLSRWFGEDDGLSGKKERRAPPGLPGYYEDEDGNIRIR